MLPQSRIEGDVFAVPKFEVQKQDVEGFMELEFSAKPQLAARMLLAVAEEGVMPFKYVAGDTVYGNSPDFIETIESYNGKVIYLLAVPGSDRQTGQKHQPILLVPAKEQKGR